MRAPHLLGNLTFPLLHHDVDDVKCVTDKTVEKAMDSEPSEDMQPTREDASDEQVSAVRSDFHWNDAIARPSVNRRPDN